MLSCCVTAVYIHCGQNANIHLLLCPVSQRSWAYGKPRGHSQSLLSKQSLKVLNTITVGFYQLKSHLFSIPEFLTEIAKDKVISRIILIGKLEKTHKQQKPKQKHIKSIPVNKPQFFTFSAEQTLLPKV